MTPEQKRAVEAFIKKQARKMKLNNASITFLVGSEGTTIELHDNDANKNFCRIKITPKQLSQMLSRLGNTPCECEVFGLEKLNKKHECEKFSFEIPEMIRSSSRTKELHDMAILALKEEGLSDWTPDEYFSSQDSFFEKDGKVFARATIRRWV